jgi:hypothetical protein
LAHPSACLETRDQLARHEIPSLLETICGHLETTPIAFKAILDALLGIAFDNLNDLFSTNISSHNPPSIGSALENDLSISLLPNWRQHMRRAYHHS